MSSAHVVRRAVALATLFLLAFFFIGEAQQERIIKSLNLQDADLNAVLRFLSEFSGQNIAASTEVQGTVDVQLRDVTWRQALEVILKISHLTAMEEEEGYIRVLPIEELHNEELSAHKYEQDRQDLVPLEHVILPVEHATAQEVKYALTSVLSKRGRIEIDARTNSLVVTDIPENLVLVAALVEDLDKKTPQITISAELYEVESGALLELGIDWTVIQDEEPDAEYPETDYERRGEQVTTTGLSEAIGKFTYSTVEDNVQLDAMLSAMVSDNKAEILAHPEITTLDNKEATILMGKEVPLKVLDEAGNVITQLTQVGTQLTVTPHVTADSTILLELEPERSDYIVDPGAGIIINTQRAHTNVVVNDGQTAVIGGLTTEDTKKSEKGLPLLKDIPLLGRLFKFTRDETLKTELVILVTPRIVISKE